MTLSDYIKQVQSYEEYSFSWEELLKNSNAPESTLRKELARLVNRNEVQNLRKGFYLIIPPRYQSMGKIPIQLYLDKLFKYLNKPYYISLYSAATFHGASHQQVQQDYVMTIAPALRDIHRKSSSIRFFKTRHWPEQNIVQLKSDAGLYNVSSPALTAVDLIHYQNSVGGINRMLPNLEELIEEISLDDLKELVSWYPNKSTLQRLGFLLETLGMDEALCQIIHNVLKEKGFFPSLLSTQRGEKPGRTGNRWKVDINIELESDL